MKHIKTALGVKGGHGSTAEDRLPQMSCYSTRPAARVALWAELWVGLLSAILEWWKKQREEVQGSPAYSGNARG
jgi:hypothetical protein